MPFAQDLTMWLQVTAYYVTRHTALGGPDEEVGVPITLDIYYAVGSGDETWLNTIRSWEYRLSLSSLISMSLQETNDLVVNEYPQRETLVLILFHETLHSITTHTIAQQAQKEFMFIYKKAFVNEGQWFQQQIMGRWLVGNTHI